MIVKDLHILLVLVLVVIMGHRHLLVMILDHLHVPLVITDMLNMNNIKLYENVLSPELCREIITKFESHPVELISNEYKRFKQYSFEMGVDPIANEITALVQEIFKTYILDCGLYDCQVPVDWGIEGIRVKKYYDSECDFKPHVDVLDHTSAKRYLAFLFYLNTVDDGTGRTIFIDGGTEDFAIQPREGGVVVFPPTWEWPHYAEQCSQDKYIMSTYINFL